MRIVSLVFGLGVMFLFYGCPEEKTDGEIAGQVTSGGQAVVGATITTSPNVGSATTDAQGNFGIAAIPPDQNYTLTSKKDGYDDGTVSVFVGKKEKKTANITMVQKLPELQVDNTDGGTDFSTDKDILHFTLKNKSGFGSLIVSSISVVQSPTWLSFDPATNITVTNTPSGTVVNATVNRNVLTTPTQYQATVTFNSNGGNIFKILTITKQGVNAQLSVTPADTLKFGSGADLLPLTVKNVGPVGTTLQWQVVTDNSTWLPVSSIVPQPISGGGQQIINVSINRTSQTIGSHVATLTFKNNNDITNQQAIPVSMQVFQTNGTITGTIKDFANTGIVGATVTATPGNYSATSGTGGAYTLNVQTGTKYTITASKSPEYADSSITGIDVGATSANIVLRQNTGSISGKVTLEDGVTLVPDIIAKISPADAQDFSSPDGNFSFSGLKAGTTYTITATKSNYGLVSSATAQIGTTNAVVKMKLQTGSITGIVTDDNGQPQATVTVSLSPTYVGYNNYSTISDGKYQFDGVPYGTYTISVSKNGLDSLGSSQQRTISSSTPVVQNLQIHSFGSISGNIKTQLSKGAIVNAQITLTGTTTYGNTTVNKPIFSGSDGKFTFTNVSQGNYTVTVTKADSFIFAGKQQTGIMITSVSPDYIMPSDFILQYDVSNISGLVAYYPFNNDILDKVGNQNLISTNYTPTYSTDRFNANNAATQFSRAVNQTPEGYIDLPNPTWDFSSNNWTFSCWMKKEAVGSGGGSTIFHWLTDPYDGVLIDNGPNKWTVYYADGSTPESKNVNTVTNNIGEWHHVVIVHNGSTKKFIFYLDGNDVSPVQGGVSFTNNPTSPKVLYIGSQPHASNTNANGYLGLVDEFRVYNTALTPDQVKQLFNER